MTSKWVDVPSYSGLTRRTAPKTFRLLDRRRHDLAEPPPSLLTLLRRLRYECGTLDTPEGQGHYLANLPTITTLAHENDADACAQALNEIARIMRGETQASPAADLDVLLMQAIALAA